MSSLFEVLQTFREIDLEKRRQPTLERVICTDADQSSSSSSFPLKVEVHHEMAQDSVAGDQKRHVVQGTSRMAFGNDGQLSDMFQHSTTSSTSSSAIANSKSDSMDIDELPFEKLSVEQHQQEGKKSSESHHKVTPAKAAHHSKPEHTTAHNGHHNSNNPIANKKPAIAGSVGNGAGIKPKGSTLSTPKSVPGKFSNIPSSSVPSSKQAAMAKMAALGEEWPEEEELPGMKLPVTSSLNGSGDVTKDTMKQFNNATQRQKKVIIAKKKS